jgi:hypothetical protein
MNAGPTPDRAIGRLGATIVGLIFGQLASGQSETVAKLILFFWHGMAADPFYKHSVFETQLVVLFGFTMIGGAFGVWMAVRGWAKFDDVVWGIAAAVLVALFSIIDVILPETVPGAGGVHEEFKNLYYVAWAVVLLIVPLFILPRGAARFDALIRMRAAFLAVVVSIAFIGFVAGAVLRLVPILDDFTKWILSPATLDPIAGAFVAVAFAPWWSRRIGGGLDRAQRRVWVGAFGAFAVIWTGFYGAFIYGAVDTSIAPIPGYQFPRAGFFVAFAAYAVVVTAAAAVAFMANATRPFPRGLVLAVICGAGFALVTWVLVVPLLARINASVAAQPGALVLAHGLNGVILGCILSLPPWIAARLNPEPVPPALGS